MGHDAEGEEEGCADHLAGHDGGGGGGGGAVAVVVLVVEEVRV